MSKVDIEIYDFIQSSIHEKGSMKFCELRSFYDLSDEDILSIEHNLARETPSILRKGKSYFVEDFEQVKESKESFKNLFKILQYHWEVEGANRLTEIFDFQSISKLTDGDMKYALKKQRKEYTGDNRTSFTKKELAHILILFHGRDLFSDKEIRSKIAKKCGLKKKEVPVRWVSGSFSSKKFVQLVGFPNEFSGIKMEIEKRPSSEFLRRKKFDKLVDFQNEIREEILGKLKIRPHKFLISLPTGAGKTKVAVHSILEHINTIKNNSSSHVLWLAHTEELCEQAYGCFKNTALYTHRNYDLRLFRYWGNYASEDIGSNIDFPHIFISTPQKIKNILCRKNSETAFRISEVNKFFRKNLFLLIIDEAHRAGSPTYLEIINNLKEQNDFLNVAGLTATPFRTEYVKDNPHGGTKNLKNIFGQLIVPKKTLGHNLIDIKKELCGRQYLAKLKKIKVDTSMNIELKETDKNFISMEDVEKTSHLDKQIQSRVDTTKRRMIVLNAIKEEMRKSPNGKFLYFGPTVKDVRLMTLLLRNSNYSADYVIGSRKIATRRRIINDFKNDKLQVLCNCEVLTTGFDEPKITHLVMARPTVSQVLYEQMIGRGLRGVKFGGTDICKVLSCEDMNLNYDEFYRIWKNDLDFKSYRFEEVFERTLIFALRADGKHKEIEKDYFKKSLKIHLKKEIDMNFVDRKIEENFKYFEELPAMIERLTRGEKRILIDEATEMCKIDGELHQREKEFLKILMDHTFLNQVADAS